MLNNTISETINLSPFFVNYNFDSCFSTDLVPVRSDEDKYRRIVVQALSNIHDATRNEILSAQDQQRDGVDWSRLPVPDFQIGQNV